MGSKEAVSKAGTAPMRMKLSTILVFLAVAGVYVTQVPNVAAERGDLAARMIERINQIRKEHNLAPVAGNRKLARAASIHASDIARNDLFGHRGSDGSRLEDRLKRVAFKFKLAAENVAGGLQSPEATVDAWMDSTGHRRNLLNPNMCRVGIGYAFVPNDKGRVTYKHYWTLVLARPPGPFCKVK